MFLYVTVSTLNPIAEKWYTVRINSDVAGALPDSQRAGEARPLLSQVCATGMHAEASLSSYSAQGTSEKCITALVGRLLGIVVTTSP